MACTKDGSKSFRGIVTKADNCCSVRGGGRLYSINLIGTDSALTAALPAGISLGDTIAFHIHTADTTPAMICLAICSMPEIVQLSEVRKVR